MLQFITGDRSVHPAMAMGPVAVAMLKLLKADPATTFATGDNTGVESAVALVGLATGIEVTVVASPHKEDGSEDWDARHASLFDDPDVRVTFIHGKPEASRIGKSLIAAAANANDDERLTLLV